LLFVFWGSEPLFAIGFRSVLVMMVVDAAGLVGFDFGQTGALFFVVVVVLPSGWC
jgi:hypothetical protein